MAARARAFGGRLLCFVIGLWFSPMLFVSGFGELSRLRSSRSEMNVLHQRRPGLSTQASSWCAAAAAYVPAFMSALLVMAWSSQALASDAMTSSSISQSTSEENDLSQDRDS